MVRFVKMVLVVLVCGLALFSSVPLAAQVAEVSVGIVSSGTTSLAPMVIRQQKLAEKHGLKITWIGFVSPRGMYTAYALGKFPVCGGCSLDTVIRMINNGRDVKAVYSHLRMHLYTMVRKDAPYKTLADLKGKRYGIFSWSTGSSATMIAILRNNYGLNMRKDLSVKVGKLPALAGLLGKGQFDAIHIFEPIVSKMILSGKFRAISDSNEEWKKISGNDMMLAGFAAYTKWASDNGDTLRRLLATFKDYVTYLKANPKVYMETGFIKKIGLKPSPRVERIIQQRITPVIMARWDQALIDSHKKWLAELVANKLVKRVPPNWYSLDYVPR